MAELSDYEKAFSDLGKIEKSADVIFNISEKCLAGETDRAERDPDMRHVADSAAGIESLIKELKTFEKMLKHTARKFDSMAKDSERMRAKYERILQDIDNRIDIEISHSSGLKRKSLEEARR